MQPQKLPWWPFKIMALIVPASAVTVAVFTGVYSEHLRYSEELNREWLTVFYIVIGGGNGCILGFMAGDLRLALCAMLAGAAAGFALVNVMTLPAVGLLFCALMLACQLIALELKRIPRISGILGLLLILLFCYWALLLSFSPSSGTGLAIPFGYPMVCMLAGTATSTQASVHGFLMAMMLSSGACVRGIVFTLPVWVVSAAIMPITPGLEWIVAFCSLCLLIANLVFVETVFNSIPRVGPLGLPSSSDSEHA